MNIETFLKKLPSVMGVLTSKATRERLSDMTHDIEGATNAVKEAAEDAAEDIVEIMEELLEAMSSTHTRVLRTPEETARLDGVRALFEGDWA